MPRWDQRPRSGEPKLGQERLNLPDRHAAGVERENFVVEACEPALVFGDQGLMDACCCAGVNVSHVPGVVSRCVAALRGCHASSACPPVRSASSRYAASRRSARCGVGAVADDVSVTSVGGAGAGGIRSAWAIRPESGGGRFRGSSGRSRRARPAPPVSSSTDRTSLRRCHLAADVADRRAALGEPERIGDLLFGVSGLLHRFYLLSAEASEATLLYFSAVVKSWDYVKGGCLVSIDCYRPGTLTDHLVYATTPRVRAPNRAITVGASL